MAYSLFISGMISIILFPLLKRLKQQFKSIGPSHEFKHGTPTMGGIIIILGTILSFIFLIGYNKINLTNYSYIILIPFLGNGLIGLIDDLLKLKRKSNDGLSPIQKMIMQSLLALIYFVFYMSFNLSTVILGVDIKWLYGVLLLLMLLSTTNATNLTDGLDGLLTGLMIIALMFYYIIVNDNELLYFVISLIGALYIFLILNFKKAKIFMGDTGSLALGGFLVGISVATKTELYLIILCLPFIVEVLSVIIQVLYFKMTRKRFFKMAPIHHHFERLGLNEEKIVIGFYLGGLISLFIALIIYFI